MTLSSILDSRYALWAERLAAHGYELLETVWDYNDETTISIRALRSAAYGAPQVALTIVETWHR